MTELEKMSDGQLADMPAPELQMGLTHAKVRRTTVSDLDSIMNIYLQSRQAKDA